MSVLLVAILTVAGFVGFMSVRDVLAGCRGCGRELTELEEYGHSRHCSEKDY